MADFKLKQTGQEIQNILDYAETLQNVLLPVDENGTVNSVNFGENNTLNVGTISVLGGNNIIGCRAYKVLKYKVDKTNDRTYVQVDGNEEISTIPVGTPVTLILQATKTRLGNTVSNISFTEGATIIEINKSWLDTTAYSETSDAAKNIWQDVVTANDPDNLLIFPDYPSIGTTPYGENIFVAGKGNKALGIYSTAIGRDNSAENKYATATGRNNKAGYASFASGRGTQALGDNSHTEGQNTLTTGNNSHAEGSGTKANGLNAHAEGSETEANGFATHAEGAETKATKDQAHAEGLQTTAEGQASHAEGYGTKAKGTAAHAEGYESKAIGNYSHAGGKSNTVDGESSVAYGDSNEVKAPRSMATGVNNKASGGHNIYIGGENSEASRGNNIVHGNGLLAKNHYAKAVFGSHNEDLSDTHLEIGIAYVGEKDANGNQLRRNGFTVHHDGHAEVFKVGTSDKSVTTRKYVDEKIADLVNSSPESLNTLNELSDALNNQEDVAAKLVTDVANKVDKIEGKGLSTNDFNDEYKEKLDNEIVGEFTVDGSAYVDNGYTDIRGEKFNDYGNNRALAPGSHAEGTRSMTSYGDTIDNIAGCMCYEIKAKSEILGAYTDPQITISDDRTSGTIKIKGNLKDSTYHGSGAYAQGDVFSLITDINRDECGAIESISDVDSNGITVVTVTFYPDKIIGLKGTDDYGTGLGALIPTVTSVLPFIFKVNSKPLTGIKALGLGAHTEGVGNQALADGAHAEGRENKAMGRWSHVEGYGNTTHYAAHAEGQTTEAHYVAHAEGHKTKALGNFSHAEGLNTIAQGNNSHAEGSATLASSSSSHAEGESTSIKDLSGEVLLDGKYTVPENHGTSMWSGGSGAHAEGQHTIASSNAAHAEGNLTYAIGSCAHAEGHKTIASGYQTHAEGMDTIASGSYGHAEGTKTEASGNASHAEGNGAKATGNNSHAEGQITTASGKHSHAEGYSTTASGKHSHAEGYSTTASGGQAHAEGDGTTAEGNGSHAEGYRTHAVGNQAHAEGDGTTAEGNGSHAEGYRTHAVGNQAHAEGNNTRAEGTTSHAEGSSTKATKHAAHAEGCQTQATGDQSHAEGLYTIASGNRAHAEGWSTEAKVGGTHSAGIATVAGYAGQTVVGIANDNKADNVFEVGNGSYNVESDKAIASTRSNAFEVSKAGTGKLGGNPILTVSSGQEALLYIGDAQPAATPGKITVWINLSGAVKIIT